MNILEFEITGQLLKRIDTQSVVSKNKDNYRCQFTFEENSEWSSINKFAIFTDGWGNSSTVHLGNEENIITCNVPNEVLEGSYFKISIYGGEFTITNYVTISLVRSDYKGDYSLPSHLQHHTYHSHLYTLPLSNIPQSQKPKGCHSKREEDIFVEIFNRLDEKYVDSIIFDDENKTIDFFCKEEILDSVYLPFLTEEEVRLIANNVIDNYFISLPIATNERNGLLSSEDKTKLDGIEEGATRIMVDNTLDGESQNPISNSAVTNALNGKEDSYNFVERLDNLIVDLINNNE